MSSSLITEGDLTSIASALGWKKTIDTFPFTAPCPKCGGRLTVSKNTETDGYWHHCEGCQSDGDLEGLLAAAWSVPRETLAKELKHRVSRTLPDKAERARTAWAAWSNPGNAWNNHAILHLRRHLGIQNHQVDEGLFRERFSRLCGVADAGDVERLFCPNTDIVGKKKNPSASRVFRGHDWNEVLTVPYFDAPDRVAGWLFVGRAGTDADHVHRRCLHRSEFGLAGVGALAEALAASNDPTILAVSDATLMLRLQMRHLRLRNPPLPIVAYHDSNAGQTQAAWNLCNGSRVVCWEWTMNARGLRQAMLANADLAIRGPTSQPESREARLHYLRLHSMPELWSQIVAAAKPWMETLRAWCHAVTPAAVLCLVRELQAAGVPMAQLFDVKSDKLQEAIHKTEGVNCRRTIMLGDARYIERVDRRWFRVQAYRHDREHLIMDAVLRIDEVLGNLAGTYYRGRILYNDNILPFLVPSRELEQSPLTWIRDTIARAGLGLLNYDDRYDRQILSLANMFHAPKTVEAPLVMGWKIDRYCLPYCQIGAKGVSSSPIRMFPDSSGGPEARGVRTFTPSELRMLQDGPSAALGWAGIIGLTDGLRRRSVGLEPYRMLFGGEHGIVTIRGVLHQLVAGAAQAYRHTDDVVRKLFAIHDWPALFEIEINGPKFAEWLESDRRWGWWVLPDVAARRQAATGRFHLYSVGSRVLETHHKLPELFGQLLINLLAGLAKLPYTNIGDHVTELAGLWLGMGGQADYAINLARRITPAGSSDSRKLADMLAYALVSQELPFFTVAQRGSIKPIQLVEDRLVVPRATLVAWLKRRGLQPLPDAWLDNFGNDLLSLDYAIFRQQSSLLRDAYSFVH